MNYSHLSASSGLNSNRQSQSVHRAFSLFSSSQSFTLALKQLGHFRLASLSWIWHHCSHESFIIPIPSNYENTHTARITSSRRDFPGSPGRQSPRNRRIASQKNIHTDRRIFQRPSHLYISGSSFEPPKDFLESVLHLIKGSKKGNKANSVLY